MNGWVQPHKWANLASMEISITGYFANSGHRMLERSEAETRNDVGRKKERLNVRCTFTFPL
jgi:hypothetical protein